MLLGVVLCCVVLSCAVSHFATVQQHPVHTFMYQGWTWYFCHWRVLSPLCTLLKHLMEGLAEGQAQQLLELV